MKLPEIKIQVSSVLLFVTTSTHALQPEVIYAFQLGPRHPYGSLVQGIDGKFYGTTAVGGTNDAGTVFQVTTNGILTTLVTFNGVNGSFPYDGLILGSDGSFYGTTSAGGTNGSGTVFHVRTNGELITLASFTNGGGPHGGLVLGSDGNFYGTTSGGGSGNYGTVFKMTPSGVLTTLVSFSGTNGMYPYAGLVFVSDGNLYGTTFYGGSGITNGGWPPGLGTVFRVTTNGALTTLVTFDLYYNGANPAAELVLGRDGSLYGTTTVGSSHGGNGDGTVFKVTTNGVLTTLVSFAGIDGRFPQSGLVLGADGHFYGTTEAGGDGLFDGVDFGTIFRMTTSGVLTTLVSFNSANGRNPNASLVLGSDGDFYGTTLSGGNCSYGNGTVFKVTTNGALTTLAAFTETHGTQPNELVSGKDNNFYGTTSQGGSSGGGTVFKVTPSGLLTTLVSFAGTNGSRPSAGLLPGSDGHFYGTTQWGGNCTNLDICPYGCGTVFRVTTNGMLTTLVSLNGTNGAYPNELAFGSDGNFYGTTGWGGSDITNEDNPDAHGTVFRVTTNGALTTLVSFSGTNGASPQAGVVLGSDGNLYGTTFQGGASNYGTVFKVTTDGALTTLVSLNGANGQFPRAGLVLGGDRNLYGTTELGGSNGIGTVFQVTTNGMFSTLVSFDGDNGRGPRTRLLPARDGSLYGTTPFGTVFRITTNGVLTTLVESDGFNDAGPLEGLVWSRDGDLYGTTRYGGAGGGGTIYRLVMPRFSSMAKRPDGSLLLAGVGPPNEGYRLWANAGLSLPLSSWTLVASNTFDSSGNFSFTDASAATNFERFYRLSVP